MQKKDPTPAAFDASRFLPVLLVLFAGSGCSALIYEIVWYQLLELVIGSTAVSLGVLLATFMGGLCLGSLLLPRILARKWRHPLRIYAVIEAGIGAFGILVLFCMPLVDSIYTAAVGHGMPAILFRALICAVCLMPPTLLMGASLPAIARWIETSPRGVSWLGLLYGANTVGAVSGCLLAGFYLLRVFDMATATFAAAAINAVVALVSWVLGGRTPEHAPADTAAAASPDSADARRYWPAYVTIALSGATALGAEVVWTRLLSLLFGATVYTFSIILAIFLIGIAIGSGVGSMLSRSIRARTALGVCQFLLAGAIAWTALTLALSLPYWPVNPLLSDSPWITFQVDMARAIWTILPATLFWGASFPLALAGAGGRKDDPGQLVGTVYAANTAGAIGGALAFSMILIPAFGTQQCQRILIVLAAVSAMFVLGPVVWRATSKIGIAAAAAALALSGYLVAQVAPVPGNLIAYGRRMLVSAPSSELLYTGEGMNSSIAITRWNDGAVQFHVSGKVEASTEPFDMRLQRMLGHMPALVNGDPKSVLIVGFGAGVTAGTFVVHPTIQKIVICEMERIIPPTATRYFGRENYNVMNDPRTTIYYDDARHFVLTSRDKFDIITSDPIHPWVKGSATLYSKEYFEMVKDHLNPGGVVTQWVPLYESSADVVKSEIATFFSVFPGGSVWANELNGGGYDVFLLGQAEPTKIDIDAMQARLDRPDYARVTDSLRQVGLGSAIQLLATYAGQDKDLQPWLQGAEINRDGNLRLQYMAGMAVNSNSEEAIYSDMLRYRQFPFNLITGSERSMTVLASQIGSPRGQ
ncbi:MAG TPA: fused MFS/spermidine synthase [Verrucomicrobiae bacterium]|nr:fused MFS/spermidine synthase [Verrucomicrobiae bacterium]